MVNQNPSGRGHELNPAGALRRAAAGVAVAVAAGLLAGCPPTPPTATRPAAVARINPEEPAPVVGSEPVLSASGVLTPLAERQPYQGAALARASRTLDEILQETKRVAPATSSRPAKQPERREPPPAAIKAYLQGREKYMEGAYSEAIDALDNALRLDPQSFTVLKLMGKTCFASNQLARGSLYLQRAAAIEPEDMEVNYLLGRYWVERQEWPSAIYYLLTADLSPERDPTSPLSPVTSYHLALALQAGGYSLAAAKTYDDFLLLAAQPVAGYRYDRELNVLMEEAWAVHLAAAENYFVVRRFADALPHYEAALAHEPKDTYINSRMVAALMRAGQKEAAIRRAQDLVSATGGTDDALLLLAWAYRQAGQESRMLPELKARVAAGSPGKAVLGLASLQERMGQKDAALQTLLEYQRANPQDAAALMRTVKLAAELKRPEAGFGAIVIALRARPEETAAMRLALARLVGDRPEKGTLEVLEKAPAEPADARAQRSLLLAVVAQAEEDFERATKYYEAAIAADPNFWAARDAYLSMLLAREQFGRAREVVQQAIDAKLGGAKAYLLSVASEVAQDRYASALKIARQAKDTFPGEAPVRVALINVLTLRGETRQARAELTFLLDRFPKEPAGYERMIDLQLREGEREAALNTLGRMLRELPENRFARKLASQFLAADRNYQDAEQALERLLKENPEDQESLILLATVRQRSGHGDAAIDLLKQAIDGQDRPDPRLVDALCDLYEGMDRADDAAQTAETYAKAHPESELLTINHASVLVRLDRKNDADAALKAAVARFPKSQALALLYAQFLGQNERAAEGASFLQHFMDRNGVTAERLYRLSSLQEQSGQFEQCVATLKRVLQVMPDHTGANNDLGYYWADRGEHLDEARQLIARALENEPNNPAFLDSMAWAYYKEGKYTDAIALLEKAVTLPEGREPELLAHLGDALWRSGRTADATQRWRQADGLISNTGGGPRDKVKAYLAKMLRQVDAKQEPEVSPVAPPPR